MFAVLVRAGTALFWFASCTLRAGIPEPDVVWYGKVLTAVDGVTVRVTAGTLTWRIQPVAGGAAWTNSVNLSNINDQFSFVLRIASESPEPAVSASPNTIIFTTPSTVYSRVSAWLDGQPLNISGASTQFAPSPNDRGRLERIDLTLGTVLVDSDGDGMADAWEQQYFGNLSANPDTDSDGDGVKNINEFRAGTNPIDPQSRFALLEAQPVAGGVRVRWSSQPNLRYKVRRASTLLNSAASYSLVQAGIDGTPPINTFLDVTAAGTQSFYLIEIEE